MDKEKEESNQGSEDLKGRGRKTKETANREEEGREPEDEASKKKEEEESVEIYADARVKKGEEENKSSRANLQDGRSQTEARRGVTEYAGAT